MHSYNFHIGDYRRDTMHLTMLEHGAYRQLLDWIYLDEKLIPKDIPTVCRRLSAKTHEEKAAVEIVLKEMFILGANGYSHKRVFSNIKEYNLKCAHNREAGKLGGRPKKTQTVSNAKRTDSEQNPILQPLTINHEPSTIRKERVATKKGTRLSSSFPLTQDWIIFALNEKPELTDKQVKDIFSVFKDYWTSKPGKEGVKLDWFATWRNWVRREKSFKKGNGKFSVTAHLKERQGEQRNEKNITGIVVEQEQQQNITDGKAGRKI